MTSATSSRRGGTASAQRVRAEGTRARLIDAARALFTEVGYHATSTIEVVARAALTRGALYHHFTDKADLFEAVFREVLEELNDTAQASVRGLSGDLWRRVTTAFTAYLRLIASRPDFQRILLIDGPTIFGWGRWRALHTEYIAADTIDALIRLMEQGIIERRPAGPLARLILAALNEAALSIAHADDPDAATDAFLFLIDSMRLTPCATAAGTAPG